MNRRTYLTTISMTIGGLTMAGCSSDSGGSGTGRGSSPDCSIEQASGGVDPVAVTVDGRVESATVELDLRWNARVQNEIASSESGEGEKYLVFLFEMENTTEKTVPIIHTTGYYLFQTAVETPNTTSEEIPTIVATADQLIDEEISLKAGGTFRSRVIFTIPENATGATITVSEDPYIAEATRDAEETPAFNPECDESLSFDESEEDSEESSQEDTGERSEEDTEGTPEDGTTQTPPGSSNVEEAQRKAVAENWWGDDGNLVITSAETGADGNSQTVDITGIVENLSDESYDYIQIEFAAYDQSGARVADVFDNTSGLSAGGRWRFDAVGFVDDSSTVSSLSFEGFSGY